jgi:hypothetical protein
MAASGHVFVVRGDATAIACDWRLITSGTDPDGAPGDIGDHWTKAPEVSAALDKADWPKGAPDEDCRAVVVADPSHAPSGLPGVIAVHTGDRADRPVSWFAEALIAAARAADPDARHLPDRALPLLVTPLLGTGAGGAGGRRAGVLEAMLRAAQQVAASGWDVSIVVRDEQSYSAAQRLRSATVRDWPLEEDERKLAAELAAHARAGKLVPFLGAGTSVAAGLPTWSALLEALADEAGIVDTEDLEALANLDARDAAVILESRLRGTDPSTSLRSALVGLLERQPRSSLVHVLVGSLPIREAATTNYDALFERAWQNACGEDVAVLPSDDGRAAPRWLLKLHGDVTDATSTLVLSRRDYLRFERQGGAIAGVMQAILLTRHLLILGYGLADETFHRLVHDVREVRQEPAQRAVLHAATGAALGTALLVNKPDLSKEVWKNDVALVDLTGGGERILAEAARRQEIVLDLVAHLSAPSEAYLLGAGWHELSVTGQGQDSELRKLLMGLRELTGLDPALQRAVDDVVSRFGGKQS